MDSEEDTFFNQIICVDKGYSDSDSDSKSEEETLNDVESIKENKKKVTQAQRKKLLLFMNGRAGFTKGKMKQTEETRKILDAWEQLVSELNAMGPPIHSSSKWRRVWTRIKSMKKRKLPLSSVLRSPDDNKRTEVEPCTSKSVSNPINHTSSVKHGNIIISKNDVELEQSRKIELPTLESISKTIDSFVKQQVLVNQEVNKKIDLLVERQEMTNIANGKLIRLSEQILAKFSGDII